MKKQFLLLVCLFVLLFSTFVSAQNYGIWLHTIDIELNSSGEAQISEKFHLFFPTDEDKLDFRTVSTRFGSNIREWEKFNPRFTPTIGNNNTVNGKISYSDGEANYLELNYGLLDSIMAQGKETSLITEYSVKANYFNKLYESGLWVIPDNTQINITFPPGAEIKDTIAPSALASVDGSRRVITWNGYKSANQLSVKYILWKKISPIVDLEEFSNYLFRTSEGLTVLFVILILILIVVWQRKKIGGKIESFVENNTILEEN
jgi:hypothetical protein